MSSKRFFDTMFTYSLNQLRLSSFISFNRYDLSEIFHLISDNVYLILSRQLTIRCFEGR